MLFTSHNIFWFQGYPAENDMQEPVNEIVYHDLVGFYRKLNPDLVLLQEVQSAEVAKRFSMDLGMSHYYLPGQDLVRYGGAVLFKDYLSCELLDEATPKKGFQRLLQCFMVQINQKLFKFCNLHLPSERQLTEQEASIKRLEEMNIALELKPDFICGDFNEIDSGGVNSLLVSKGFRDSVAKSFKPNRSTTIKGRRGDFVFVRQEYLDLLKSFEIIDLEDQTLRTSKGIQLSDHYPLIIHLENI